MTEPTEEKKLIEAQLKDAQKVQQGLADRLEVIKRMEADAKLGPLKDTAARAHDLLCPYNHTDGCSWGYENGSWKSSEHSRWLRKIDALVNGDSYTPAKATLAQINIVLDAIADLKPKVSTAMELIRRGLMP
jgi:hypothetical protein